MLRKIQILIVITVFLALNVYAGDTDRIGTAGGVQVLQPVGAKGIALGGSNIASTQNVDAIFWNPAGLAKLDRPAEGHFSTMNIFNDIRINYFAFGFNMAELGVLGASVKFFDFGNIPLTTNQDEDGESGRTFSPTFATIGLTYAINLTDRISVGLNSKVILEEVPRASASTIAFDIGLQYSNFADIEGISFGLAIKNIGADLQYSGSGLTDQYSTAGGRLDYLSRDAASNDLPSSFEIGVGYEYSVNEENSITASTMFQSNNFSNDIVKFGAEYNFQDFVMLRGGYNYINDINTEDQLYDFTLGGGIKYDLGGTLFQLDYAFRNDQYFDANNVFSVTLGF